MKKITVFGVRDREGKFVFRGAATDADPIDENTANTIYLVLRGMTVKDLYLIWDERNWDEKIWF